MKKIYQIISTLFFIGYLPFSATLTSLISAPFFIFGLNSPFIIIIIIFIGIYISGQVSEADKLHDPKYIVIDELAGQLISFLFIPINLSYMFLSIIIFRTLDIMKPFPIKKFEKLPGGLGIMADDIVGGIMTNIILQILLLLT